MPFNLSHVLLLKFIWFAWRHWDIYYTNQPLNAPCCPQLVQAGFVRPDHHGLDLMLIIHRQLWAGVSMGPLLGLEHNAFLSSWSCSSFSTVAQIGVGQTVQLSSLCVSWSLGYPQPCYWFTSLFLGPFFAPPTNIPGTAHVLRPSCFAIWIWLNCAQFSAPISRTDCLGA